MGSRDHTEQCPKCGVWCGGLDNLPCVCDMPPSYRCLEASLPPSEANTIAALRAEVARLREALERITVGLSPDGSAEIARAALAASSGEGEKA